MADEYHIIDDRGKGGIIRANDINSIAEVQERLGYLHCFPMVGVVVRNRLARFQEERPNDV